MKKLSFLLALLSILLYSCKNQDLLDPQTSTTLNKESTFADSVLTMRFMYGIYSDVSFTFSYKRYEGIFAGTDEGAGEGWGTLSGPTQPFVMTSLGTMNPTQTTPYIDAWNIAWRNIRRSNVFLGNVKNSPLKPATQELTMAEVRFLRAWYYAILLRNFGGVPLIGDKLFEPSDDLNIPRNTYAECVSYIISELDAIANVLPIEHLPQNYGRITKGACLGLKARVLLYAASPLFNGGGVSGNPELKALTSYPDFNPDRWKQAADAAEAVIKLNKYMLMEDNVTAPGYGFSRVFLTRVNTEYVLPGMLAPNKTLENRLLPPSRGNNTVESMPTQNLAEAFGMIDGKPIVDGGPIAKSPMYAATDPFKNRDPRFNYTFIYNETPWYNNTTGKKDPIFTYDGAARDGYNVVKNSTGYFWRKMMSDNSAQNGGSNTDRCFPLIRYAEILLAYAEAKNEMGDVNTAYEQLKLIRKRAGILPGADGLYGLTAGLSKDDMRKVIQNEYRVEFAYEDHRYFDVRRWKIAPLTQNQTIYAMKITKTGNTYTYAKVVATPSGNANHVFVESNYLFPIPQTEINRDKSLVQNPGY
ncbi:RagB/SusD family nutrient uptake outer membrane protein [Mucilaginibacter sp. PAMB04274]|uniref:RagB/SusD family nutrient uptake outer membrane protein n=1 Tax=Mucilaginibacter sp. PAMB04274 TaxID=3138568 RepID=UPI0031F70A63